MDGLGFEKCFGLIGSDCISVHVEGRETIAADEVRATWVAVEVDLDTPDSWELGMPVGGRIGYDICHDLK